MNRYILICRLRWPAILLMVGVLALLYETGVISDFWRFFWPLLFILVGLLLLVERAALATAGYPPYPGSNLPGAPQRGVWQETSQPGSGPAQQSAGTEIAPSELQDFGDHQSGAQS